MNRRTERKKTETKKGEGRRGKTEQTWFVKNKSLTPFRDQIRLSASIVDAPSSPLPSLSSRCPVIQIDVSE